MTKNENDDPNWSIPTGKSSVAMLSTDDEGDVVGGKVGSADGAVGLVVGSIVGVAVGLVGDTDGTAVGADVVGVGIAVGVAVGASTTLRKTSTNTIRLSHTKVTIGSFAS